MAETQQTQPDQTGIQRDAQGTILDHTAKPGTDQEKTTDQTSTTAKPDQTTAKTESKSEATLAGEKKPEGGTLADDGKGKPTGPPEKYEFKAPEGYELDQATIDKVTPLFKEAGLSQDAAQKLVDFYAEQALAAAEAPVKYYTEMREGWRKEVIADKSLGNGTDGLKPDVKATIGRAIDSLGPAADTFREAMNITGVGDHPAFVKAMYEFGKRFGEGKHVSGNGPSKFGSSRPDAPQGPGAAAMYPHLANKST